ncbi:MAG: transketolase-like TK C-terminal-containing protein, partial [Acidimicrobiia bacterium]
ITIDGATELAYTDNVPERFSAYGWQIVELGELANDLDALENGLRAAMADAERPSLVVLRSHIGWPSPKYTDTPAAHGSPLGEDEVRAVKEILGMPPDAHFWVPDDVLEHYRAAGRRGAVDRETWNARHVALRDSEAGLADDYDACIAGTGHAGWEAKLPEWNAGDQVETRKACSAVLDAIAEVVPGLVGGGADLTGNTGTELKDAAKIDTHQFKGRQLHFGIREHGMGAIMNGMATGGLLPFGGTFFVFSDYMRGAVRLAALSGYKVAFVWSHDSIGLGEDGPTHQPIEHLASLRAMPGLRVIRPADANEVAQAWRVHIDRSGPTALILTRQKVPVLEGSAERAPEGVEKGAYTLVDEPGPGLDLVLVGTGSEVQLCVGAAGALAERGTSARVVSMPCWELFAARTPEEQAMVLPPSVPTLAVEAGTGFGWERYADDAVAIDRFGASAPGATVMKEFGFSIEHVTERALALLGLDSD